MLYMIILIKFSAPRDSDIFLLGSLVQSHVSHTEADELIKCITIQEIYSALLAANPNKAPGPDGIGSEMYKTC